MSDFTWGSPAPPGADRDQVVTHHLRVEPSRSMTAVTGEVEALLDGLDDGTRRRGAFLASELVAQVVGREPCWDGEPVGLTIERRAHGVRLQATGPIAPSVEGTAYDAAPADPLADWGRYILDRLADRWGVSGGARQDIWAEVTLPA